MALKKIVDTLEGIAEAQQALYVKQADGKFKLDLEGDEDTGGLKTALQKERDARAALENKLKGYDGIDIEEIRKLQTMVENSEDARLLRDAIGDKDKLTALRNRWTEGAIKAKDKEIEKLNTTSKTEIEKANQRARARDARVLDNELRSASEKVGVYSPAIEDILVIGRGQWVLDDDGNAVMLGKDGQPVGGAKGNLTPAEWLESLREAKPHWFPASGNGGGAQPNKQVPKGKTMRRSVFDGLNAADRRDTVRSGVQVID